MVRFLHFLRLIIPKRNKDTLYLLTWLIYLRKSNPDVLFLHKKSIRRAIFNATMVIFIAQRMSLFGPERIILQADRLCRDS
jgi:hypothetical protein